MSKKLIITEKPSVARDFARVLGVNGKQAGCIENNEYVITWCVGHLVEMLYPEDYDIKYKKWRVEDLPFLPVEYKYGVIENVKQQYEIVSGFLHSENIDTVYWAGDSGKEGQTIEENIRHYGGVREGMTELRVWIDSQTDDEIKRGIAEAKPMEAYKNLGKSGIMRSIEDYALGINFSRALSVKYGKLLNDTAATKSYTAIAVGRVMTCVLGMVVIREREIRCFTETPFYRVLCNVTDVGLPAEWRTYEGSQYYQSPLLYKENGFKKEESAQKLITDLSGEKAFVQSVDKTVSKKKAPLLFNLAELQAECAKLFKINPDETLQVAQELYEKKLTTYPRTDARVLTKAVSKEIYKNLSKLKNYAPVEKYVNQILNSKMHVGLEKTAYVDDSKVTDHYAIIPTGQTADMSQLSDIQRKVYDLIVRRFLSIFYTPAEYLNVKMVIDVKKEYFYMSAKVLQKKGYMEISGIQKYNDKDEPEETEEQKEQMLKLAELMKVGDEISVKSYEVKEGKTSPPKRYTSGTMILAMENAGNLIEDEELRAQIKNTGIGTSATRAEIIKKLVKIGYINLNNKTQILTPENLGEMIFEVVDLSIPSLLNPKMTASWEKGLEGITNGTVVMEDYREKLEEYIRSETLLMINNDLRLKLASKINPFAGKGAKGIASRKNLGIPCPVCGGDLTTTSFGYGCSNFFNKEKPCKFSIGSIAGNEIPEEDFIDLITKGKTKVIDGFISASKKKFSGSLIFLKDKDGKPEVKFDFSEVKPEVLSDVKCPDCGKELLIKSWGVCCSDYKKDAKDGCKFNIGKIADKELSKATILELLTTGKTQTIRGFKSKTGTKFDACLVLKEEEGKHSVSFDFDHVEAKELKDTMCPICGKPVIKTTYGFACSAYNKDDPQSCKFSIGKLCGKDLTETQVKELLQNGKTSTVYGFKSKNNKKFDACVALDRDENGVVKGVKFDFEHIEDKKLKDVVCPLCKGQIAVNKFGYHCINNKKDDPESCKFYIGKIAGVSLKEASVKQLLTEGSTDIINGFVAKTGMMFDAKLKLKDGKVAFDFGNDDNGEPVESELTCPVCQKNLMYDSKYYSCECGYKLLYKIAGLSLSSEVINELLTNGKTAAKVVGFTSKAGNSFDAFLKRNDNKIEFDFERKE